MLARRYPNLAWCRTDLQASLCVARERQPRARQPRAPFATGCRRCLGIARALGGLAIAALLLAVSATPAIGQQRQIIVLSNRAPDPVACHIVFGPAAKRDYRLSPGESLTLRVRAEVEVQWGSGNPLPSFTAHPNAIYCFLPGEKGHELHEVSLSRQRRADNENPQPADATPLATAPLAVDEPLAQGILQVKLLVDDDQITARQYWEKQLRQRLDAASKVLRHHTGMQLQVVAVDTWESDDATHDFGELLAEFEARVDPGSARLAIGFLSQPVEFQVGDHIPGIRSALARHLLVPDVQDSRHPDLSLEQLLHDLGHFLGASHSPEIDSVMGTARTAPGQPVLRRLRGYDAVNTLVMALVAEELRTRGIANLVDLSPAVKQRVGEAYSVLSAASPRDAFATRGAPLELVGRAPPAPRAASAKDTADADVEVQEVVAAVVEAAERNYDLAGRPANSGAPAPRQGDALFTHYVQAAAAAAGQLPLATRQRAFLVGLGVALDRSELLRANYLFRKTYRRIEDDAHRARRIEVLGDPTIWSRPDLAQHFAVSALLTALQGPSLAESAGVFKELLDSQGGSGFSFVDLLADLAGVAFAERVLAGHLGLDQLASGFTVEKYMPDDRDLRERLTWQQFAELYGSTNDPRFAQELLQVRQRVQALPEYVALARLQGDTQALAAADAALAAAGPADPIRDLQSRAVRERHADWGHWGPALDRYVSWSNHSNRLIPVYTFGIALDDYQDAHSPYRQAAALEALYGQVPAGTLNPQAEYFDQTAIHHLQAAAAQAGKKRIILMVFDGMDWVTTWAAATYRAGRVAYRQGRGTGLAFQDYQGAPTDFGFMVTSPWSKSGRFHVDDQVVLAAGDQFRGGYDPALGGATPWQPGSDPLYLTAQSREQPHAYTDSSSSATSMCAGIKTYNQAVNFNAKGAQVETIARQLQAQHGFAIGVVTSVPISHATPACAYANNVDRNDFQDLTRDLVGLPSVSHRATPTAGVDVLLGAGWGQDASQQTAQGQNHVPGNPYITEADLRQIDAANGGAYQIAQRTSGQPGRTLLLAAAAEAVAKKRRLFGLFGVSGAAATGSPGGHLPFRTADGRFDPVPGTLGRSENYTEADLVENPSLADMTEAALSVLEQDPDGFWLMVEAGDVDWANHDNNIDNSIGAVVSGDEAFQRVVQWVEAHGGWANTALIVTADHGHYLVLDKPEALVPARPGQPAPGTAATAPATPLSVDKPSGP